MSNTIIRARRRHRFVIIDQQAIEDTRLSWAARGLLGYLLSRPDDWKVLVNDLRKRGDLGRDGIYRLLKDLRNAGYIQFIRKRDKHGRIRGGTYLVQEIASPPHPDFPDTAKPDTVEPNPVKPGALPNTDLNLRKTTTTKPTDTKKGSSSEIDNSLKFADWVAEYLHEQAAEKVSHLNTTSAQMVIDEWAGSIASGEIERSPLGYLYALVKRLEAGDFTLRYADKVEEIREHGKNNPSHLRSSDE
ncbi:MAG: hypothetical protein ACN4GR_15080 [Arenicellales bacterium]